MREFKNTKKNFKMCVCMLCDNRGLLNSVKLQRYPGVVPILFYYVYLCTSSSIVLWLFLGIPNRYRDGALFAVLFVSYLLVYQVLWSIEKNKVTYLQVKQDISNNLIVYNLTAADRCYV